MLPLELAARNVQLGSAAEAEIRRRAFKLSTIYERIMSCRVVVEMPHRHHERRASYLVSIDITVPGDEIVIKRKPREILLTAIQDAFDAAERSLREFGRRRRGNVKTHAAPLLALVKELYPLAGYGFLETQDGHSVYFDEHAVLNGGFLRLTVGTQVRYVEESGEKGPQASTVVPLKQSGAMEEEDENVLP